MKKIIEGTISICDVEGCDEVALGTCIGCMKDYCYDHRTQHGTVYTCEIGFQQNKDIYVCHKCKDNPPDDITKDVLREYYILKHISNERRSFLKKSNKQADIQSKICKELYDKLLMLRGVDRI